MSILLNPCRSNERLTKSALLGLVRAPSILPINIGERVEYTDNNGSTNFYRIAAIGSRGISLELGNEIILVQRSEIKTNNTPFILDKIPLENWSITSFNSKTRVACVTVINESGTSNLSITVPEG